MRQIRGITSYFLFFAKQQPHDSPLRNLKMPPARRGRPLGSTSSQNNPRAAQQTLAFGRNNKITKPSLPPPSSRKVSQAKSRDATTPPAASEVAKIEDVAPVAEANDEKAESTEEDPAFLAAEGRERGMAIRGTEGRTREKDGVTGKGKEEDVMELKAKGVSEAAVKRYWREREGERKAARGWLFFNNACPPPSCTHTHTLSLSNICTRFPPPFFFFFFLAPSSSTTSRKRSSTPIISPRE